MSCGKPRQDTPRDGPRPRLRSRRSVQGSWASRSEAGQPAGRRLVRATPMDATYMLGDFPRKWFWSYVVTAESVMSFRRACRRRVARLSQPRRVSRGTGCRGRSAGPCRRRRTPHFQHSSWEAVRSFRQPRPTADGRYLALHGASDGGENGRYHASQRI